MCLLAFQLWRDMYIYVRSRGKWTGPPDAFVRLSVWYVILLTSETCICIVGQMFGFIFLKK